MLIFFIYRRLEALRERQAERLAEDRKAAEEYIESVRELVGKKIETERASDGEMNGHFPLRDERTGFTRSALVSFNAWYGECHLAVRSAAWLAGRRLACQRLSEFVPTRPR